jgi:DNA processing protein
MIERLKPTDTNYPENLREVLVDLPLLYCSGTILPQDRRAVAIVGTRRATTAGLMAARHFARVFAEEGITVVSGLALGIDAQAHQAALQAGGRTIAVLGSGLDIVYPKGNVSLASEIVKHGALLSEFPLGTEPLAKNFLQRNRIIAGLSLAVVVIEGGRKSGTISTASHAANLGREVFALKFPVSEATKYLRKQGAQVANSPKDILEYVNSLPA